MKWSPLARVNSVTRFSKSLSDCAASNNGQINRRANRSVGDFMRLIHIVTGGGGIQFQIEAGLSLTRWRLARADAFALDGRLHVEKHMFDVSGLVEAHQALGVGFDLVF
jgi:hypothetical protein